MIIQVAEGPHLAQLFITLECIISYDHQTVLFCYNPCVQTIQMVCSSHIKQIFIAVVSYV